jgi:hypothetical protein
MTARRFLHSIIYTYTHIYTHVRIKVLTAIVYITRALCCRNILLVTSLMFVATGVTKNSSPRVSTGGDEFFSKQVRLDASVSGNSVPIPVRAWHCRILEKKSKREWLVVCSDDAFPALGCGWVCDCGRWTWGEDTYHTPFFYSINVKVVAGRRKKKCRK